jgi:hypothetical protein
MGGSDHVYTGAIVAQARLSRNCGGTNELQMATLVGPDLRAGRLLAGSPVFDGRLGDPPYQIPYGDVPPSEVIAQVTGPQVLVNAA